MLGRYDAKSTMRFTALLLLQAVLNRVEELFTTVEDNAEFLNIYDHCPLHRGRSLLYFLSINLMFSYD